MSPKKADTEPSVPGAIWFRVRPPARSTGSLSRNEIARATVTLLDDGGHAALSLRALANRLGVHATSLYWHVSTRDDLLDLAIDTVFSELDLPERPSGRWTDDIARFMRELRAALLRHPWAGALAASRPLLGPQALQRSEFVYCSLHQAGFRGPALVAAAASVSNLVIGSTATESAWHYQDETTARRAMHQHLHDHNDRYPTLASLPGTETDSWTDQFERAMDALLRGLNAQISDLL
ncbi:TetR/AcrR family transcriptional regulator [Pseudonocardia sp. HH130629-09]|uniref:TetR/AcrR family transcriptional regulator n=1 Tax=Pseudonocardia sp. HH130629-09 TaxID=1641402 RepID=UPI0006CB4AF1|nr:TetR/AcrR family transcriptional regulator C-terminal domain-containing protein [Pseudonocardia sp. HH130629-09]ALE82807.1 TetR family transcriptional regulator [Pseudonocardia sp. HH130629-09]